MGGSFFVLCGQGVDALMQSLRRELAARCLTPAQCDQLCASLGIKCTPEIAKEVLFLAAAFGKTGALQWAIAWLHAPALTTDSKGYA